MGCYVMNKIRDRLWEKAGKMGIPLTGAFEILPVCNLSCKMCYVRKSLKEVNEQGGLISGKQWIKYAKEAFDAGMLFPLITGGEPFLHPDFKEIMVGMQDLGMQVSINSNGTMIDEEIAEWLSHHTPTRINITVYGASEEAYQKLCGNKDAFYKMKEAVKLLKKYQIPVKFNTSITPENVNELDGIMQFAKNMDVPIQVATYMFPPIRRDSSMIGKNNRLSPEQAAFARVKADYLQNDLSWFKGQANRFSHFVDLEKIDFNKFEKQELKMVCRAGLSSLWIDWQGNMINCGMYSSAKVSLKNKTIKEAWKEIRNKTREVRYAPYCSICPNRALCHPCIAMVSNECGDVNGKPDYICEMNQASAKYYMEFIERLRERGLLDEESNQEIDINNIICGDDCDMY